jgi:hypothetical protein
VQTFTNKTTLLERSSAGGTTRISACSYNVLPTFIHKLAMIFPPFRTIVANRLRDDSNLTPESMKGSLLLDFIRRLPRHPERTLVFVIDALDECGNTRSRPGTLKVLTDAAAQAPWLKLSSRAETKSISNSPLVLSPRRHIYDMTWPKMDMPLLICERSPEDSSIRWPGNGISPPRGPKNRTSRK